MAGSSIVIRRTVPSQNHAQYRHWSTYTRERDAWYLLLRSQMTPRDAPAEPVRLIIHSYRIRLIDYANLVGGAKAIPDCLIRLGYIKDDSPRWFTCDYFQTKVPRGDERTELTFVPWSATPEDGDDAGGAHGA